jgi:hypothetical protein
MRNTITLFGYRLHFKVGLKLFLAAILIMLAAYVAKPLAFTLMVITGLMLSFPTNWKYRANRLAEGDPDDDDDDDDDGDKQVQKILKSMRKQTEAMLQKRGVVNAEALKTELDKRMKPFEDLKVEELKELLGEGDKGIRAILKKQGEDITAMKESASKKPEGFRSVLDKKMAEIEKVFNTREGEIKINVRAAVPMTLENTMEGHDTLPDELIESFSIASFVPKRQPREYVFDMATRRTVSGITQFKTWLEEGDDEGAFAIVAEGGLKPLVSMKLVRNSSEYKKVAAKYVVTEEFKKFRKEAYSIIQRLINQKILRDYAAILTTNLLADAAPYVASALDGQYPANKVTDFHAIGAVAAQIEALDFFPDMLILNPQDKWRIGLSQDSNGQFYLTIPITDPSGQTRMMGFTVRTSNRVPVGEFILGESGLWEIEDEPITVRVGMGVSVTGGTSNGGGNVTDVQSDFDHNRMRVIVETFFHNYIASNNQGSFVHADFDVVKALVTAP